MILNDEYDRMMYDIAIRSKERLGRLDTTDFREMVTLTMRSSSLEIWLEVFEDDPDMCERFWNKA